MLRPVLITLRFIILIFAGHQQVVLENAALRQQVAILKISEDIELKHLSEAVQWRTLYFCDEKQLAIRRQWNLLFRS